MADQQRTYPAGVTSWVDVTTDDLTGTQSFYGDLFGWTFTPVTPPDAPTPYVVAQLDGADVAGIGGPGPAAWHTYVAVDDIEASLRAVEAAGGSVVDPVEQAGEGGWNATVADPEGTRFRLWQARRRLGVQVSNAPGAWNFSDLFAGDPEAVGPFYTEVFGWRLVDLGFGTAIQVPGYGDHLASTVDPGIHERQAAVDAPAGFADVIGRLGPAESGSASGWRVTFTVADRDESADLAESLGARVVRREESGWTRTADVVDPQGAALTLSQFTPGG